MGAATNLEKPTMSSQPSPQITAAAMLLAQLAPGLTPHELDTLLRSRAAAVPSGTTASIPAGQLLKVAAAAARLGMGQRTIWRWQKLGVIPSVRLGRSVRFREADIVRIAAKGLPRARISAAGA